MARDSKLVFTFTNVAAALPVLAISGAAVSPATAAQGVIALSGAALAYGRGVSNALNIGGFRNMLANAAQFIAGGDATAIASDPAISGNMGAEMYLRATLSQTSFVLGTGSIITVAVEGASDSGSGTAGTDWAPISAAVSITTAFTGNKLISAQITDSTKPWMRVAVTVLHGSVLSSGSITVTNAALTLGRDSATHALTL
jgi:hypothetical protein